MHQLQSLHHLSFLKEGATLLSSCLDVYLPTPSHRHLHINVRIAAAASLAEWCVLFLRLFQVHSTLMARNPPRQFVLMVFVLFCLLFSVFVSTIFVQQYLVGKTTTHHGNTEQQRQRQQHQRQQHQRRRRIRVILLLLLWTEAKRWKQRPKTRVGWGSVC